MGNSALPGRPKVYRDPVHGDIAYPKCEFQELVSKIIDTELFQRLRGIRQTGVVNLVFQGAEHSRFAHSMGVAHVAGKMFDAVVRNCQLNEPDEVREQTVLAALLHDVGHGPFSHLLEEILNRSHFDHEKVTGRIIADSSSPIAALLNAHRPEFADSLLPYIDKKARTQAHWSHGIVSSQLDADRFDYLARDAKMTGVFSHHFDAERLISFLGMRDDAVVVDIRARDVVENYLLALDQMYQAVYYHRAVRAASFLVLQIIKRAIAVAKESEELREELFPSRAGKADPLWSVVQDGSNVALDEYVRLDEAHVWTLVRAWRGASDPTLADLVNRFSTRRFPKAIDITAPTDFLKTLRMQQVAMEAFQKASPTVEATYFVGIDQSDRLSYKRYNASASEGLGEAIRFVGSDDKVRSIEELDHSFVEIAKNKLFFHRLMVPDDATRKAVLAATKGG